MDKQEEQITERQKPFKINMTYPTSEMLGKYILSTLETTEAWVFPISPEEQKADNEPTFPICGTCNARKEIDTWHEKEVICPWCGHKHIDSWEMGTGEYVCSKCEKPFYVEKEIEVYYTTTKVEVKSDGK